MKTDKMNLRNDVSGKGIMKKRILTILVVVTVSAGVMVGCTSNSKHEDAGSEGSTIQTEAVQDDQTTVQNEGVMEAQEEASEVSGTVDEIKDFMFVVTDDNKVCYAFTFEERPEGLDEIAVGDKVIIKYTGTISEVDPFMGKILSIEKQPKIE